MIVTRWREPRREPDGLPLWPFANLPFMRLGGLASPSDNGGVEQAGALSAELLSVSGDVFFIFATLLPVVSEIEVTSVE
jgi:hypothetical protein